MPERTPELLVVGERPDWYLERLASEFTLHLLPSGRPEELDAAVAQRVEALTSGGVLSGELIAAL